MKKYISHLLSIACCGFILNSHLSAQAPFLRISPNARQVGMGEAFTGMANDYNLMRYNVGGLGLLSKAKLATNYHGWIGNTRQGDIEFSLPMFWGVAATGITYFSHGSLDELNADFSATGTETTPTDIMLSFGYGRQLSVFGRTLSVGVGSKLIRQDLAGSSASAIGVDIGWIYQLKHISLGATFQNFTVTKLKFIEREELLPETLRGGLAFRIPVVEKLKVNVAADVAKVRSQDDLRYYSGLEMAFGKTLRLRGGYKWHDFEASRWATGFGLTIPMEWLSNASADVDYAFSPLDAFDDFAHRFSFTFTFNNLTPTRFDPGIDTQELTDLRRQLKEELERAQQFTRSLEDTLRYRLAHIQRIAMTSKGAIEVVPDRYDSTKIHLSLRINFNFDSSEILRSQYETMEKVAQILNTYPDSKVWISGHTDSIGTQIYNMNLSMRRMKSVQGYLVENSVRGDRFFRPIPYGEGRPVADNGTSDGRWRNRRVDFTIFALEQNPEMPEGSLVQSIEAFSDTTFAIICNGKVPFELDDYVNPPRISVDMPGILYIEPQNSFNINRGNVKRARIAYHREGYTRVVFDLAQPARYDAKLIDNAVIITVRSRQPILAPSDMTDKN